MFYLFMSFAFVVVGVVMMVQAVIDWTSSKLGISDNPHKNKKLP